MKYEAINQILEKLEILKQKKHMDTMCMEEVSSFFEEYKFKILNSNNKMIKGTKDELTFEFINNSNGLDIVFQLYIKSSVPIISETIVFRHKSEFDELFDYWKKDLKINGERLLTNNYENLITSSYNEDELIKLIEDINENYTHIEKVINELDKVKYIYAIDNTSIENDSFKELFNKICSLNKVKLI